MIAAGKPLFIDKPMAASLADVIEIFRLADEAKVPCFSSSSLRFGSVFQQMRNNFARRQGPWPRRLQPVQPRTAPPRPAWYGVHGVEILFTIMGRRLPELFPCTATDEAHLVVGTWTADGLGRSAASATGKSGYGVTVFKREGD